MFHKRKKKAIIQGISGTQQPFLKLYNFFIDNIIKTTVLSFKLFQGPGIISAACLDISRLAARNEVDRCVCWRETYYICSAF
jgi:hypothetical protein